MILVKLMIKLCKVDTHSPFKNKWSGREEAVEEEGRGEGAAVSTSSTVSSVSCTPLFSGSCSTLCHKGKGRRQQKW